MSKSSTTPIWFLDVPFTWRPHASAAGARWDANLRATVYKGDRLPEELKHFQAPPLSWPWHCQYHANGRHLVPISLLSPQFKPRPHQAQAAQAMLEAYQAGSPGFALADEVGVGKTLSAWEFAKLAEKLDTVLIVTTSSAQAHWRNSVRHAGWRQGQAVVITSYDRLGELFAQPEGGLSSTRKKGKRKRLAKQGTAPEYDLVIFDEAHKGKNPESARSLMMRKIGEKAKFCVWASATLGQNPVELVYLAPLLAFATGQKVPGKTLAEFAQWCQLNGLAVKSGAYGRIEWETNDHDLEKIYGWLFKPGGKGNKIRPALGIRRLPEQINGWPAMERQVMPVSLSPEKAARYAVLWEDFLEGSSFKTGTELERDKLRLRQESSLLRVDSTVDLALDRRDIGHKVAISVAFRATQEALVQALEKAGEVVAFIHGQMDAAEKERQRLLFQSGPATVVVFTVEEAVSFHQGEYDDPSIGKVDTHPRTLLVHDIRWSAIQMAQIEGRCHRDGKFSPSLWIAAEDTVDIDIAERMASRVAGMKSMHGDPVGDLKAIMEVLAQARVRQGKSC